MKNQNKINAFILLALLITWCVASENPKNQDDLHALLKEA